jgi:DNA-binding NtrC family response regulator
MLRAFVVDDDKAFSAAVAELLEQQGLQVVTAATLREARKLLTMPPPDLLLVDLMLPDGSGLDLIQEIQTDAATKIVVITGHASLDAAIESLRARVFDFLVKPIDLEQLQSCIRSVTGAPKKTAKCAVDPIHGEGGAGSDLLIGESPVMQELKRTIEKVAPTDATILLLGASGTGKDIVAKAVHQQSNRRDQRYLAVNCGAVSSQLIGSELFGHERGSFTGAHRQHKGYFERASGGTLFLDEVTEMPLELQVQLLRVLETGTITRLGGDGEIPVDVRLIAATNRNPDQAVQERKLREDLFFRLMVFPIHVPLLRERTGDAARLANYFLGELNRTHGTEKHLSKAALSHIERHTWPGNVRELRNAIQRAFILAEDLLDENHFGFCNSLVPKPDADPLNLSVGMSIDDAERRLILATLEHYDGDKPRTADALGVSLKTLYNRLKQYEQE